MPSSKKLHHIGIVYDDIDDAIKFMREVLDLEVDEPIDLGGGSKVAFAHLDNIELELIQYGDQAMRDEHLGDKQAVIEHICFETDDAATDHAELAAKGVTFRGPMNSHNDRKTFFTKPENCDGMILQYREQLDEPVAERINH